MLESALHAYAERLLFFLSPYLSVLFTVSVSLSVRLPFFPLILLFLFTSILSCWFIQSIPHSSRPRMTQGVRSITATGRSIVTADRSDITIWNLETAQIERKLKHDHKAPVGILTAAMSIYVYIYVYI